MKIKIVQYYYSHDKKYLINAEKINLEYCKKFNIDFYCEKNSEKIFKESDGRNLSWYKLKLLLENLQNENYDYVIYIDSDAIFVNTDFDIRNIIQEHQTDLIIGEDFGPDLINGGVLIFKNTEWSKNFLTRVWDVANYLSRGKYKTDNWLEQTVFSAFLMINENDRKKTTILPHNMENSINSVHLQNNPLIYHDLSKSRINDFFNLKNNQNNDVFTYLNLTTTSDRHVSHKYFNAYIPIIKEFNSREKCPNILDIGGDSGITWKCVKDKSELCLSYEMLTNIQVDSIKTYEYSPLNLENINHFLNQNDQKYDIIIDDFSHKSDEHNFLFENLFIEKLNDGGLYIIEDIQTDLEIYDFEKNSHWKWGDPDKKSFIKMIQDFNQTGVFASDYFDSSKHNTYIEKCKVERIQDSGSLLGIFYKK